jgi:hypothetical protein
LLIFLTHLIKFNKAWPTWIPQRHLFWNGGLRADVHPWLISRYARYSVAEDSWWMGGTSHQGQGQLTDSPPEMGHPCVHTASVWLDWSNDHHCVLSKKKKPDHHCGERERKLHCIYWYKGQENCILYYYD